MFIVYITTFQFTKGKNTKTIEKEKKREKIKQERYNPIPKKEKFLKCASLNATT